jgi:hypothetical protein
MNHNSKHLDPRSPWLNRTVRMGPGVADALAISTKAGSTSVMLRSPVVRSPGFTYVRY